VGVGNLGRALALHGGLARRGFEVAALVDVDPAKIGEKLGGVVVSPLTDLAQLVASHGVTIGVIATPAEAAQEVASAMVESGVSAILSFAPMPIGVPDDVVVRAMDVSSELQILSFHCVRMEQARLVGRR
jgi:redox-sensing transcriptional repressor